MNTRYIQKSACGKARIVTTDFRGNREVLSGWFKNAENAAKELRRRKLESPAYGLR